MARLSFALPILDRCERPRTASVRVWRLQPGRLAQGPDEKCGMTGRTPGGLLMALSFQIESPSVGRGGPPTEIRKDAARVKRFTGRTGSRKVPAARIRELRPARTPLELDSDADP